MTILSRYLTGKTVGYSLPNGHSHGAGHQGRFAGALEVDPHDGSSPDRELDVYIRSRSADQVRTKFCPLSLSCARLARRWATLIQPRASTADLSWRREAGAPLAAHRAIEYGGSICSSTTHLRTSGYLSAGRIQDGCPESQSRHLRSNGSAPNGRIFPRHGHAKRTNPGWRLATSILEHLAADKERAYAIKKFRLGLNRPGFPSDSVRRKL